MPAAVDHTFYQRELAPILPPVVLDFHTHTWDCRNWRHKPWDTAAAGGRYMVTTETYPPEQLLADGAASFPDRPYHAVTFGYPTPAADPVAEDAYVVAAARRHPQLYPLLLAGQPLGLPAEEYRRRLDATGAYGFKVFLNWLGDDYGDLRLTDMLGEAELTVAHERRLVLMLHVPRAGRLADPAIQADLRSLARAYPQAQFVLAHCGRCYLPAEMRRAVACLPDLPNVALDTSMVMEPLVFVILLRELDAGRLVYGSDFPVAAMCGRRVRVREHWVDVVQEHYPESAWRVRAPGLPALPMAQEIAYALREATLAVGLDEAHLRAIFHDHGMNLLRRVIRCP
jgi:hypothetical protein